VVLLPSADESASLIGFEGILLSCLCCRLKEIENVYLESSLLVCLLCAGDQPRNSLCCCALEYVYVRTGLWGLPSKLMAYRHRKSDYVNGTREQYEFLYGGEGGVEIQASLSLACWSLVHLFHICYRSIQIYARIQTYVVEIKIVLSHSGILCSGCLRRWSRWQLRGQPDFPMLFLCSLVM
jgi:hypothetical protein